MCGIVGAIAARPVSEILLEGLRRLEYRGYDSAGMAVWDGSQINRLRRAGKVQALGDALAETPLDGQLGIAHTRWATHGKPTETMPIRTCRVPAWQWCTTASSKTSRPSSAN